MKAEHKAFLAPPPNEEAKIEVAEPMVLIAGQYEDLYAKDRDGNRVQPPPITEGYRFKVHTFNVFIKPSKPGQNGFTTYRDITCSAGPEPHAPQPCLGCYSVDHGKKDSKQKDQWAFNIAHLGYYHMVPFVKDGQVQMKKDNSGPILIKEECPTYKMENILLGRGIQSGKIKDPKIISRFKQCEHCAQGVPHTFGDHRLIQLGFGHLKNLFEIDDQLGKRCLSCGTHIIRMGFKCSKCNTGLLDIATATGWTNDQIEQFAKTETTCQCGHTDLPKSIYQCGFDENYNQIPNKTSCEEPKKMSVFHCVLWIQRQGENTDSEIVVKKMELISQYVTHDNRPLQEHLDEICKAPFNFEEMYKPESVEEQARVLQIPNPWAAAQPQYTQYPGQGTNSNEQGTIVYPNIPVPGRPNFGK